MRVIFQSLTTGIISAIALGCGLANDRLATVPVKGKVVENGKPVANATVVFHPVGSDVSLKPCGRTNEQGEFELTSYDGNDGAPAGQYRVTIELWQTLRADDGPVSRLPAKFAKPESSGFQAKVPAGSPVQIPAFEIKR